eukprot:TRINITY_DN8015_c0_g1_i3.p1 TRINITY_DN8015_c0_g1~~TRINITY_DN8015_c0_g1_i3.p1  ORF type:complete len:527 (-),score=117.12 TRINITY_DN8015_c0_g1_i3:62-1642(-)
MEELLSVFKADDRPTLSGRGYGKTLSVCIRKMLNRKQHIRLVVDTLKVLLALEKGDRNDYIQCVNMVQLNASLTHEETLELVKTVLETPSQLYRIEIHGFAITMPEPDSFWAYVNDTLKFNVTLVELVVNCSIEEVQPIDDIAILLRENKVLRKLAVMNQNIWRSASSSWESFAAALQTNSSLEYLALKSTGMDNDAMLLLVESLSRNTSLQHLVVGESGIRVDVFERLLSAKERNPQSALSGLAFGRSLKSFSERSKADYPTYKFVMQLVDKFGLTSLSLSDSASIFEKIGQIQFSNFVLKLKQLQVLKLSSCGITGSRAAVIVDAIKSGAMSVTSLDLSRNEIEENVLESLALCVGQSSSNSLRALFLNHVPSGWEFTRSLATRRLLQDDDCQLELLHLQGIKLAFVDGAFVETLIKNKSLTSLWVTMTVPMAEDLLKNQTLLDLKLGYTAGVTELLSTKNEQAMSVEMYQLLCGLLEMLKPVDCESLWDICNMRKMIWRDYLKGWGYAMTNKFTCFGEEMSVW